MRLFIYEAICAGALGSDPPPSLKREGWAMLSAVADDFDALADVEVVTLRDAANEATAFARTVAGVDGVLVIAPEFDDMLVIRSEMVLAAGKRLLGCTPDAVRLCGDKFALFEHWRGRGVPTPLTQRIGEADMGWPRVVKPRHGAGSQATILVRGNEEWAASLAMAVEEMPGDELIVQPWIAGEAVSVAFLNGTPLLAGGQTLSADGRFRYQGGCLPLDATRSRRAIALAERAIDGIAGLDGYFGIDLILGECDVVVEINPRLTTSYIGLRQLARTNLAECWLNRRRPDWKDGGIAFHADGAVFLGG